MEGHPSQPSERVLPIQEWLAKCIPQIHPVKSPEEEFQETLKAAEDVWEESLSLSEETPFKDKVHEVVRCGTRIQELIEEHDATKEDKDRVYQQDLWDRQETMVFEILDLFGRELGGYLFNKWRERVAQPSPTTTVQSDSIPDNQRVEPTTASSFTPVQNQPTCRRAPSTENKNDSITTKRQQDRGHSHQNISTTKHKRKSRVRDHSRYGLTKTLPQRSVRRGHRLCEKPSALPGGKRRRRDCISGASLIPGRIYFVYCEKWHAGFLLPLHDLGSADISESAKTDLLRNLPPCYQYDDLSQSFSWTPGYGDGGPNCSEQCFAFMLFEDAGSRRERRITWVRVDSVQEWDDEKAKMIDYSQQAIDYMTEKYGKIQAQNFDTNDVEESLPGLSPRSALEESSGVPQPPQNPKTILSGQELEVTQRIGLQRSECMEPGLSIETQNHESAQDTIMDTHADTIDSNAEQCDSWSPEDNDSAMDGTPEEANNDSSPQATMQLDGSDPEITLNAQKDRVDGAEFQHGADRLSSADMMEVCREGESLGLQLSKYEQREEEHSPSVLRTSGMNVVSSFVDNAKAGCRVQQPFVAAGSYEGASTTLRRPLSNLGSEMLPIALSVQAISAPQPSADAISYPELAIQKRTDIRIRPQNKASQQDVPSSSTKHQVTSSTSRLGTVAQEHPAAQAQSPAAMGAVGTASSFYGHQIPHVTASQELVAASTRQADPIVEQQTGFRAFPTQRPPSQNSLPPLSSLQFPGSGSSLQGHSATTGMISQQQIATWMLQPYPAAQQYLAAQPRQPLQPLMEASQIPRQSVLPRRNCHGHVPHILSPVAAKEIGQSNPTVHQQQRPRQIAPKYQGTGEHQASFSVCESIPESLGVDGDSERPSSHSSNGKPRVEGFDFFLYKDAWISYQSQNGTVNITQILKANGISRMDLFKKLGSIYRRQEERRKCQGTFISYEEAIKICNSFDIKLCLPNN